MKANEAPKKLYLINDVDVVMLSYDPSTKLQGNRYDFVDKEVFPIEEGCEVEYTRTDAFMEKAEKFFEENIEEEECKIGCSEWTELRSDYETLDSFIRAFRNYMKGE